MLTVHCSVTSQVSFCMQLIAILFCLLCAFWLQKYVYWLSMEANWPQYVPVLNYLQAINHLGFKYLRGCNFSWSLFLRWSEIQSLVLCLSNPNKYLEWIWMLFRSMRCLIPDLTFQMTFKPLQTPSKIIHREHYLLSFNELQWFFLIDRDIKG